MAYLEARKLELAELKRQIDLELIELSEGNDARRLAASALLVDSNESINNDYVICFGCKNVIGQIKYSLFARFNICRVCRTVNGNPINGNSSASGDANNETAASTVTNAEKQQRGGKAAQSGGNQSLVICEANKMRGFVPTNCQTNRVSLQRFGESENGETRMFDVCGNCSFQITKQRKK